MRASGLVIGQTRGKPLAGEHCMADVGDDWAEAHHDVEMMDATGRRLAKNLLVNDVGWVCPE
jgi:hypothetical protein